METRHYKWEFWEMWRERGQEEHLRKLSQGNGLCPSIEKDCALTGYDSITNNSRKNTTLHHTYQLCGPNHLNQSTSVSSSTPDGGWPTGPLVLVNVLYPDWGKLMHATFSRRDVVRFISTPRQIVYKKRKAAVENIKHETNDHVALKCRTLGAKLQDVSTSFTLSCVISFSSQHQINATCLQPHSS